MAKEEATPKVVEEETIQVPKKKFQELMERTERLEYAASKAQLAHYDKKKPGETTKEASVTVYEGKIVAAWETVENLVEKNSLTGVWMEKQTIRLHFLGVEEHEDIPYMQFVKRTSKQRVRVLAETKTDGGGHTLKLETIEQGTDEPKKFELDVTFIN